MMVRILTLPLLAPVAAAALSSGNAGDKVTDQKRIGIIGAGAAGSSAAYHLAQYARDADIPTQIDVYERSAHVGGRSTTINPWDHPHYSVELGASIFVEVNHILVNASRDFGLRTATRMVHDDKGMADLGIWNGKEFVYTMTDEGGWWDMAKLFWRYGYAPVKTNSLMKDTVGKFLNFYEKPLFPFKSLSKAVQDVGLIEVTGLTGEQFLKNKGVGDLFANEIIQASTRVNYASNLGSIHGVETMVCMAANGAMQIDGGNWQIFDRMLSSSSSIATHLNATITHISKQTNGTYVLTFSNGGTKTFDQIILASPLQFSHLVIDPAPAHVPDQIPYIKLHVTHFATPHKLSPSAFNLPPDAQVPQAILTTIPAEEPYPHNDTTYNGSPGFFSISILKSLINPLSAVPRQEYVYKIFSDEPVSAAFLSNYLGVPVTDAEIEGTADPDANVSWFHHKLFHSYPHEFPRVTFEELKLDDGLWYTSGMESFISTMETNALMGRNIARLVVDRWLEEKLEGAEDVFEGWRYEGLQQPAGQQQPFHAKL
ncbi:prenylcysteine oxidase-like protein 1 precursor [Periconia macrospinosa]|uniref:Prenylcysteine oxidase-like protein 1 n=1 Tax=Periconia macrospinosa TaxID=97972 RepID=A0A2V1E8N9_9PLEO|nr:prenylcysteine oxidase-like protein 1 precursor [Periconia macrospinosa]